MHMPGDRKPLGSLYRANAGLTSADKVGGWQHAAVQVMRLDAARRCVKGTC